MHIISGPPSVLSPPLTERGDAVVDVAYSPTGAIFCVLTRLSLQFWAGLQHCVHLATVPIPRCSLLPGRDVAANVFWHMSGRRVAVTTVDRRVLIFEADIVISDSAAVVGYRPERRDFRIVNGASRVALAAEARLDFGLFSSAVATPHYLLVATSGGVLAAVEWATGAVRHVIPTARLVAAMAAQRPVGGGPAAAVPSAGGGSSSSGKETALASLSARSPARLFGPSASSVLTGGAPPATPSASSAAAGPTAASAQQHQSNPSAPKWRVRGAIAAIAYGADSRLLAMAFADGHVVVATLEVTGGPAAERLLLLRPICEPALLPLGLGGMSGSGGSGGGGVGVGQQQHQSQSSASSLSPSHLGHSHSGGGVVLALSGGTHYRLLAVASASGGWDNAVRIYRLPPPEGQSRRGPPSHAHADPSSIHANEGAATAAAVGGMTPPSMLSAAALLTTPSEDASYHAHQNMSRQCGAYRCLPPIVFHRLAAFGAASPSLAAVEGSGQPFTDEPRDLRRIVGMRWSNADASGGGGSSGTVSSSSAPSAAAAGGNGGIGIGHHHHHSNSYAFANAGGAEASGLTLCVFFAAHGFALVDPSGACTMASFSRFSGCGVGGRGVPRLFGGAVGGGCAAVAWGACGGRLLTVDASTNSVLTFSTLRPCASAGGGLNGGGVEGTDSGGVALLGADGISLLQSTDSDSLSDAWEAVAAPQQYLSAAYPLRYGGASACGDHVCVAGQRGLAIYSRPSRRWRIIMGTSSSAASNAGQHLPSGAGGPEGTNEGGRSLFKFGGGGGGGSGAVVAEKDIVVVAAPHWLSDAVVAVPVRMVTQRRFAVLLFSRTSGGCLAEVPMASRCTLMASSRKSLGEPPRGPSSSQQMGAGGEGSAAGHGRTYSGAFGGATSSDGHPQSVNRAASVAPTTHTNTAAASSPTGAGGSSSRIVLAMRDASNTLLVAEVALTADSIVAPRALAASLYQLTAVDLGSVGITAPVKMALVPAGPSLRMGTGMGMGMGGFGGKGGSVSPTDGSRRGSSLAVGGRSASVPLAADGSGAALSASWHRSAVRGVANGAALPVALFLSADTNTLSLLDLGDAEGARVAKVLALDGPGATMVVPTGGASAAGVGGGAGGGVSMGSLSDFVALSAVTPQRGGDGAGASFASPYSPTAYDRGAGGFLAPSSAGGGCLQQCYAAATVYNFWVDYSLGTTRPCTLVTSGPAGLWAHPLTADEHSSAAAVASFSATNAVVSSDPAPDSGVANAHMLYQYYSSCNGNSSGQQQRPPMCPLILPRGLQIAEFDFDSVPISIAPREGHVLCAASAVDRALLVPGVYPLFAPAVRPQLYQHLTLLRLFAEHALRRHSPSIGGGGGTEGGADSSLNATFNGGSFGRQQDASPSASSASVGQSTPLWLLLDRLRRSGTLTEAADYLLFTAIHRPETVADCRAAMAMAAALPFPNAAAQYAEGLMGRGAAQQHQHQFISAASAASGAAALFSMVSRSASPSAAGLGSGGGGGGGAFLMHSSSASSSAFTFVNPTTNGEANTNASEGGGSSSLHHAANVANVANNPNGCPAIDHSACGAGAHCRRQQQRQAARDVGALLRAVLQALKAFPDEYHSAVASSVRKADVGKWGLVFSTVGPPQAFFDRCLQRGYVREAAQLVRVVLMADEVEAELEAERRAAAVEEWEAGDLSATIATAAEGEGSHHHTLTPQRSQHAPPPPPSAASSSSPASPNGCGPLSASVGSGGGGGGVKGALEAALSSARRLFVAAMAGEEDVLLSYEVLRFIALLSMEVDLPPASPPEALPTSAIERAMRSLFGGGGGSPNTAAATGLHPFDASGLTAGAGAMPLPKQLSSGALQALASAGSANSSFAGMVTTGGSATAVGHGRSAIAPSTSSGTPQRGHTQSHHSSRGPAAFVPPALRDPSVTAPNPSPIDAPAAFLAPSHAFVDEDGISRPEMAPALYNLLARPANKPLCAAVVDVALRALQEGRVTLLFTLFDMLSLNLLHFINIAWPIVGPNARLATVLASLHSAFGLPRGEREVDQTAAALAVERCPRLVETADEFIAATVSSPLSPSTASAAFLGATANSHHFGGSSAFASVAIGRDGQSVSALSHLQPPSPPSPATTNAPTAAPSSDGGWSDGGEEGNNGTHTLHSTSTAAIPPPFVLVTATQEHIAAQPKALSALRALQKVFGDNGCGVYVAAIAILLPSPARLAWVAPMPPPSSSATSTPTTTATAASAVANSEDGKSLFAEVLAVLSAPPYAGGYGRLREAWRARMAEAEAAAAAVRARCGGEQSLFAAAVEGGEGGDADSVVMSPSPLTPAASLLRTGFA